MSKRAHLRLAKTVMNFFVLLTIAFIVLRSFVPHLVGLWKQTEPSLQGWQASLSSMSHGVIDHDVLILSTLLTLVGISLVWRVTAQVQYWSSVKKAKRHASM